MEQTPASTPAPDGPEARPVVTVRYWAAARQAAGRVEDLVHGDSLADVLAAARAVHAGNRPFERVLAISSLLLGDQPVGSRDPGQVLVRDGDIVEVLPPFAGGSTGSCP